MTPFLTVITSVVDSPTDDTYQYLYWADFPGTLVPAGAELEVHVQGAGPIPPSTTRLVMPGIIEVTSPPLTGPYVPEPSALPVDTRKNLRVEWGGSAAQIDSGVHVVLYNYTQRSANYVDCAFSSRLGAASFPLPGCDSCREGRPRCRSPAST